MNLVSLPWLSITSLSLTLVVLTSLSPSEQTSVDLNWFNP
jgi:hypothetical protein